MNETGRVQDFAPILHWENPLIEGFERFVPLTLGPKRGGDCIILGVYFRIMDKGSSLRFAITAQEYIQ